jgi:hypothetical protein
VKQALTGAPAIRSTCTPATSSDSSAGQPGLLDGANDEDGPAVDEVREVLVHLPRELITTDLELVLRKKGSP